MFFSLWRIYDLKSRIKITKMRKLSCAPPPPPPLFCWEGEGLSLLPSFRKGGAWQYLNFEREGAGKEGVTFWEAWWGGGVAVLLWKKSEIFNDKKLYETKMFFSVITKNLNWQILTKNSVTSKRWDAVKDNYGGFPKNQYIGGNFDEGARLIP